MIHPINRLKMKNHIHRIFLTGIKKFWQKSNTHLWKNENKNKQTKNSQQK